MKGRLRQRFYRNERCCGTGGTASTRPWVDLASGCRTARVVRRRSSPGLFQPMCPQVILAPLVSNLVHMSSVRWFAADRTRAPRVRAGPATSSLGEVFMATLCKPAVAVPEKPVTIAGKLGLSPRIHSDHPQLELALRLITNTRILDRC